MTRVGDADVDDDDDGDGEALLQARITPPSTLRTRDLLYRWYVAVVVVAPVVVAGGAQGLGAAAALLGLDLPVTAPSAAGHVAALLAAAGAAGMIAVVRTAAWRGPMVLDGADIAWLLTSPQPRARILRPRLTVALLRATGWGAVAGASAGLLATDVLGGGLPPAVAAGAVAGGMLGGTAQAGAWWVITATGRGRFALHATTVAAGVALLLAAGSLLWPAAATALVWSGPWGWAATGVVASLSGDVGVAAAALLLVIGAAGVAAAMALRAADRPPLEALAARAGAAANARTARFLMDLGALTEVRRQALDALRGPPHLFLPAPASAIWAIPWRDATALLRTPGRSWSGVALAALAGACAAVAGGLVATGDVAGATEAPQTLARALGLVVVAAVAGQGSARMLLGPLRSGVSQPFGHQHLPWSHIALVQRHTVTPVLGMVVAGLVGVGAATAASVLGGPPARLWPAAMAVLLATPTLVPVAAAAVLRPPEALQSGTMGMFTESAALERTLRGWPQLLAIAAVIYPAVTVAAVGGQLPALSLVAAAAWSGITATLAWRSLANKAPPWEDSPDAAPLDHPSDQVGERSSS